MASDDSGQPLGLLIVDDDLDDAEAILHTLKQAGFAARGERVTNEGDLRGRLEKGPFDLLLLREAMTRLRLDQVVTTVSTAGRHLPVILIGDDTAIVDHMHHGAHDVVRPDNPQHLQAVVARAARCQHQWRALKRCESNLREAERRAQALLDSSRDAIAYVRGGVHIYANQSYVQLLGFVDVDDVEQLPLTNVVAEPQRERLREFLREYERRSNGHESLDTQLRHVDGHTFDVRMEFTSARIHGKPCTQIVIRHQSDAKVLEEQINYLSQRDLVTGLYNRPYFMERLETAVSRATQGVRKSALLQLALDDFEQVKERVGVARSDLVLADVGKLLKSRIGRHDLIARFENDNFLILADQTDYASLKDFANGLLETVDDHICEVDGQAVTCTASIGAVVIDENAPDSNELLSRARRAAQQARLASGSTAEVFQPKLAEMTQGQVDQEWRRRLRDALAQDRLRLFFQPIVNLHGEPGERYEVFMRLIDTDGGVVPPGEFLPSAERTGMAKALDRWVLSHALGVLGQRRKAGYDTRLFVKLTAGSLQDKGSLPWLSEQLKGKHLPGEALVMELKEETVVAYLKEAKAFSKYLKQLHPGFALDDFGTGLNPFQLLRHVYVDYIKVDPAFTRNLQSSPENQETVRSISDTAHSMNKLVIAQQVEHAQELSTLWNMGINYIQGNFLQEPSERLDYDFSLLTG